MLEILGKYYLYAVKQYGMLVNVKADDGMGHSLLQSMQLFLKTPHGGDLFLDLFSIVTSRENQPTDTFWSLNRLVDTIFSRHCRSKFILK